MSKCVMMMTHIEHDTKMHNPNVLSLNLCKNESSVLKSNQKAISVF